MIDDFLSSLFSSKRQKVVWIFYLALVIFTFVDVEQKLSSNDMVSKLCAKGIYQIQGASFTCPSVWKSVFVLTLVFTVIAKLLEKKSGHGEKTK